MYFFIFLAIILLAVIAVISINNNLNRAQIKIDEAESGIDIALTKRYDVLTKQLDIVKGYAAHESETIKTVIELRRGMPVYQKTAAVSAMNEMQSKINVVAEAYPELKSSDNFKSLQNAVNDTEEHLQAARRAYNANVSAYNRLIATFPSSMVASVRHLSIREFFEAESTKRADVKMQF